MKQTGLRVNDELYQWLKKQCDKQRRSINNYITILLLKEKENQEGVSDAKEINL